MERVKIKKAQPGDEKGCWEQLEGHEKPTVYCPNCGGGFVQRPVRPAQEWKAGNFLGNDPASKTFKHRPVNLEAYAKLVAAIAGLPPEKR